MQTCTKCQVDKPLTDFYLRMQSNTYRKVCKACSYAQVKSRLESSFEAKAKRKASLKAHDTREHRKLQIRRNNWQKYGMNPDDAERIWRESNGHCTICNRFDEQLHVDHCHKTGQVRAMLCTRCNTILGMANDSREILLKAASYLESYGNDNLC